METKKNTKKQIKKQEVVKETVETRQKPGKKPVAKSVDQLTIAKLVAARTGMTLSEVQDIIELEQKLTMEYVRNGFKVIKKNYLTLIPRKQKARVLRCPINGEDYDLKEKKSVSVRVGEGFKAFISGAKAKMPEKICRFVDKNDDGDIAVA